MILTLRRVQNVSVWSNLFFLGLPINWQNVEIDTGSMAHRKLLLNMTYNCQRHPTCVSTW